MRMHPLANRVGSWIAPPRKNGRLSCLPIRLALACLGLSTSGCSEIPLAPQQSSIMESSATSTRAASEAPRHASGRVIARLREGVSAQDVSGSFASTVLLSVPEIRLYLFRTPGGMGDAGFQRALSMDTRVEFAEFDYALETAESRQSSMAFDEGLRSWPDVTDQEAFQRVGVGAAHHWATGKGALVAILDTGVDLDHPALADHLDFPGIEPGITRAPGDDRPEGVDTNSDGFIDGALGHGTHVAGIVLGVAPDARILPVLVLDSDGVGYAFAIARGLIAAVNRGAQIANLSLGMPDISNALERALDYATEMGVLVVTPTGNSGTTAVDFPASYSPVVSVAGTDGTDHKAPFSNYGPTVDVSAPAVGILSTYVGGGYASWSGTSMAAPFATGIAALLVERIPSGVAARLSELADLIRAGAQPLTEVDPLYAPGLGAGRVDAARSLEVASGSITGSGSVVTRSADP